MDGSVDPPSLSYPQLFSFQVSYTSRSEYRNSIIPEGSKKGEWRHGILEVDFPMETFFLQDRDRIFLSQTFSSFNKHAEDKSSDDCSLSLIFNADQWEVAAQNIAEKVCLQHLLECIVKNTSIDDVVRSGKENGIVGLDKGIIKHGKVQRKAINQKRLDERYLLLCPGKLFVFKNFDIKGKHVRYVTSVLGATIRMLSEEREFQILAPGSKTITLIPQTQEDLTSWVEALAISIGHTKQGAEGSELSTKEEEKRSDVRFSKEQMVQRTSGTVETLPHDESRASKPSQQSNKTEEVGPSRVEPRPDTATLNSSAKNKAGWDANESPPEVQCAALKLKQTFRQEDKENRDARRPCSIKSSSNKQSRAMMYLENALDEMEIIVGSIRTTRKLSGPRCFDLNDNRRNKREGISPLRSSLDFDRKTKEEQSWKGKGAYTERRWREREQPSSPGQARGFDKVPRFAAWKQPIDQISKSWQSNKTADSKSREFEFSSQLRHSLDSTAILNRTRDLPGYANSQQKQTQGRKNSSMEVRNTYSGVASPSAVRPSTASVRSIELTPATQNLLKRHSCEVLAAEANSLGRHLQTAAASGFVSRDADNRQTVTQPVNLQQRRTTDSSTHPSAGTTSSTSEDEEEEDDVEEDGEGNENRSSCMPHAFRLGSGHSSRDPALLDGHSRVQDGANASEQYIQCRQPSMNLPFSRGGASIDQKGLRTGTQHTPNQHIDSSIRRRSPEWQEITPRTSAQQSLEHNFTKQLYGASEASVDSKSRYSEKKDVLMEPTTPKAREESQSNQNIFTSCVKANNASTLQDPIYDPDFTGPQIINRRQSRLSQHDISFHSSADLRNHYENAGLRNSSVKTQLPNFAEAAATQYAHRSSRSEILSNVHGDQRKSLYGGQAGAEVSAQDGPSFRSTYRMQQEIDLARQSESSGSSVASQQGQPRADHGLVHANELPELVNRISKITAAIDGRYQEGYHMAHEGAADSFDRGTPGYGDATTHSMHVGQDTMGDPNQRAVNGSSPLNNCLVSRNAPVLTSQLSSPVRGSREASDDHINFNGADGHMRWSSVQTNTAFRDPGRASQRQSKVEDQSALMGSLESSLSVSERRP